MSKRNSMPSLSLNNFFVSKRASMFEICEESVKEKRERSPCGALDISEKKHLDRKRGKRKAASLMARRKRQADPYAEQSTEVEEDDGNLDIERPSSGDQESSSSKNDIKLCPHSTRSVNFNYVRKYLKNSVPIGSCVQCTKAKVFSGVQEEDGYIPVIWLCAFCGYQGCDRNSSGKHAFTHYKTPRSDPHCVIINTQLWTVWCYECNAEVVQTSSKKLHEVIHHVKRLSEMAPKRTFSSSPNLLVSPPTNLVTQYSGSDSRLSSRKSYDELSKLAKSRRLTNNKLVVLPKVKGISNLGNTCFFNSVVQNLSETHFLLHMLDLHIQNGQRVILPGLPPNPTDDHDQQNQTGPESDNAESELRQLDLYLSEGGSLSHAFNLFLKDMHSAEKTNVINPGHLFGQICKRSIQFQGYQQQDAHELLRCLLDAIRNEEMQRMKKAILRAFGLSEKTEPNSVNEHLRMLIKKYGRQTHHTIIDQIFGGQLISTVFCEDCHWSSQVFEPFMDLSLSINEEKGKPKRGGSNEDSSSVHCFGRTKTSADSGTRSERKKRQKEDRKKNRKIKNGQISDGSGSSFYPACIKVTSDDNDLDNKDDAKRSEERARRLTEQRRPEEEEEYRLKEEAERLDRDQRQAAAQPLKQATESRKMRRLMEERRKEERRRPKTEDDEDSGEGCEIDLDADDDDFLGPVSPKHVMWMENSLRVDFQDCNGSDSDRASLRAKGPKNFRETSDADVEDNIDSECLRENCVQDTRHPSIVVEESSTDPLADSEPVEIDSRLLRTSQSCDYLNYSSDCSERYFTAAGVDTMDELDNIPHDNCSHRKNSGVKGYGLDDYRNPDDGQDDLCLKVDSMKIRRKSSSRDSLLDLNRRGSADTQLTSVSGESERTLDDQILWRKNLTKQKLKQEWIARSLITIAPRYQSGRQECSIMSCLTNFTAPELITGSNKITCENCTRMKTNEDDDSSKPVKSNASKQLLVFSPPAVLTLHLKRFHHVGHNLAKVNRYIQFPLVLDMAPFTSSISLGLGNMSKNQTQVLYTLYGIVEHSGRLNSGHYVAYVRSRPVDCSRTSRHMMNLKPWSQFEIDRLVTEFTEDRERTESDSQTDSPPWRPANIEVLEEEVRTGRWFHVSDAYVAEVNIDKVLKAQAYLLFYERIL